MSICDIFKKELQEKFPDYTISKLGCTNHANVSLLSKDGVPNLVAKTIWHDASDPTGNMGIVSQDKAYNMEVKILKMLPSWWGLHLFLNFKTKINRVIVTNEISNLSWKTYKKGRHDLFVANQLVKLIRWLHSKKIAHSDLELKNIMLSSAGDPIIIDFEKSIFPASKAQMDDDYRKLLANLAENSNTKSIGAIIQRSLQRGTRKTQKRRKGGDKS
jgi:serine/threonine protein kinase